MLSYMQLFVDNWYIITLFVCAIILSIMKIIEFIGYPTERKIKEIKARLLIYVTNAELELGSKTGKLKLSQAYDDFCAQFPYVKKWISIEKFDELVGEVLPTMKEVLTTAQNTNK